MHEQTMVEVAKLLADKARLAILLHLLDGRAKTAGELAQVANVSAQTASSHLAKLVAANLVVAHAQGRHRYFQLAQREVAHVMEALALISIKPAKASPKPVSDIQHARSCYDHFAGRVGVALTNHLLSKRYLQLKNNEYQLTKAGGKFFSQLGIDTEALSQARRRFAYPCLDWSERVHHLAGALGAALLELCLRKRWVIRAKHSRALHLTVEGKSKFRELFDYSA